MYEIVKTKNVLCWYRKTFEQVVSWGNKEISYIEMLK
jgi:hypothetical protein